MVGGGFVAEVVVLLVAEGVELVLAVPPQVEAESLGCYSELRQWTDRLAVDRKVGHHCFR